MNREEFKASPKFSLNFFYIKDLIKRIRRKRFRKIMHKGKKKTKYEWIYECTLDPRYTDPCVATGFNDKPYCKHGLRLVRVEKR